MFSLCLMQIDGHFDFINFRLGFIACKLWILITKSIYILIQSQSIQYHKSNKLNIHLMMTLEINVQGYNLKMDLNTGTSLQTIISCLKDQEYIRPMSIPNSFIKCWNQRGQLYQATDLIPTTQTKIKIRFIQTYDIIKETFLSQKIVNIKPKIQNQNNQPIDRANNLQSNTINELKNKYEQTIANLKKQLEKEREKSQHFFELFNECKQQLRKNGMLSKVRNKYSVQKHKPQDKKPPQVNPSNQELRPPERPQIPIPTAKIAQQKLSHGLSQPFLLTKKTEYPALHSKIQHQPTIQKPMQNIQLTNKHSNNQRFKAEKNYQNKLNNKIIFQACEQNERMPTKGLNHKQKMQVASKEETTNDVRHNNKVFNNKIHDIVPSRQSYSSHIGLRGNQQALNQNQKGDSANVFHSHINGRKRP